MDLQEPLSLPEAEHQDLPETPVEAAPADQQLAAPAEAAPADLQPDTLLKEFRERSEALDNRLDTLQELIQLIRGELQDDAQDSLKRLAQAAADMTNGRVFQQIDIQAKGELGALVMSLNTTLMNLQQLDSSVKHQSDQVPELAAQLDAITADTETATQNVMNRLDTLMAASDEAGSSVRAGVKALMATQEAQAAFHTEMDAFLTRASEGADPTQLAQEILEFIFAHQMTPPPPAADLEKCLAPLNTISDEAFEILNTLQFQDITRQKVEKVVLLLKQFKEGLNRLLAIFRIGDEGELVEKPGIFESRAVATQENIFETTLEADGKRESVDDIIAQFKKGKG
jgi:chemotaxis regulatin CheY-phosphate phosphatase CheZ